MIGLRVPLVILALSLLLLAACGGDDGGDGSTSATPLKLGQSYTKTQALVALDAVEQKVRNPDASLVQKYGISETDLKGRVDLILNGQSDTSGLDDVRNAIQNDDRILAAEYLYNDVFDFASPTFGGQDAESIDSDKLNEIDPRHTFVADPGPGLPVTAVFKDAVEMMIELWYRL